MMEPPFSPFSTMFCTLSVRNHHSSYTLSSANAFNLDQSETISHLHSIFLAFHPNMQQAEFKLQNWIGIVWINNVFHYSPWIGITRAVIKYDLNTPAIAFTETSILYTDKHMVYPAKTFVLQGYNKCSKILNHYHTMPHFDTLKTYSCGKHCEKRRYCL